MKKAMKFWGTVLCIGWSPFVYAKPLFYVGFHAGGSWIRYKTTALYNIAEKRQESSSLGGIAPLGGLKGGGGVFWRKYYFGLEVAASYQNLHSKAHIRPIPLVDKTLKLTLENVGSFFFHPGIRLSERMMGYLKLGIQKTRLKVVSENHIVKQSQRSVAKTLSGMSGGLGFDHTLSPESKWAWGMEVLYTAFSKLNTTYAVDGSVKAIPHVGTFLVHIKRLF